MEKNQKRPPPPILTLRDFDDVDIHPKWSRFDMLCSVASVAKRKEEEMTESSNRKLNDNADTKTTPFLTHRTTCRAHDHQSDNIPPIPERFKTRIEQLGGTEIKIVIQKPLTKTDEVRHNSRLSIPFRQIRDEFLRDFEESNLQSGQSMEVRLIDPELREVNEMKFKRWDMPKIAKDGSNEVLKCSSMYVFRTKWNHLVKVNNLRRGDVIQVWSFRVLQELRFALVLVAKAAYPSPKV